MRLSGSIQKEEAPDGGTPRGFSGSFWGNLVMGERENPITVA